MSMKKARFGDFMNTFIADDTRSVAGKSGGADSGTAGEIRSKLGKSDVVEKKKIKNYIKKKVEQGKTVIKKTKEAAKKTGTILATPIKKFHEAAEENVRKNGPVRIFKRSYSKGGGMSVGQAKLAAKAPPPNKIDAKDFAVLRAEKAKGRGMGLQDEKIKPGKVMKANKGRFSKIPLAGKATSVGSTTMKGMKFSDKAKMVDAGKINKATGKFTSMEALRESIGYRPGESTDNFNKRRMALAAAKKAAKATTIGKIVLPIAAAGVAAQQYLKSKMNKKKDVEKKMGGGMMKKPMGYKHGTYAGKGPLGGSALPPAGRPASQEQNKKKGPGLILMMPVKEGPANQNTTIKTVKVKNRDELKKTLSSRMGGGMMQKPMGYNIGGYKSKEDRKEAEKNIKQARSKEGLRSFFSDAPKINQPMRKERYMEGKKARHSAFKKKLGRTAAGIASSLNPVTSATRLIGKVMGKESKKRDFQKGDYGDISVKKMSGGMMKPMGYRTGTFVKARGCKLGRTRPTKIT